MEDLRGKAVLVTGASTGIGEEVALGFAKAGAGVAVHYNRSEAAAEAVADRVRTLAVPCVLVQGDLSRPEVARRVVEEARRGLGRLDVVVNNAGAILRRQPFEELGLDLYQAALDLNVQSVISVSQAGVPLLEEQGGGAIINLGSIAGVDGGGAGSAHYACAKAYVHNLTRHMAKVLAARNIRVNAVAPGVIDTPFHAQTPPERMEAMRSSVPMQRVGRPEECVGPILFLASAAMSGYVTGQVLHVNGGQYMA